jgi:hypothetical protein
LNLFQYNRKCSEHSFVYPLVPPTVADTNNYNLRNRLNISQPSYRLSTYQVFTDNRQLIIVYMLAQKTHFITSLIYYRWPTFFEVFLKLLKQYKDFNCYRLHVWNHWKLLITREIISKLRMAGHTKFEDDQLQLASWCVAGIFIVESVS